MPREAARRSSSAKTPSSTSSASTMRRRVIESRIPASSEGVRRPPPSLAQKIVDVGRLEHDPVGAHQQRLVAAAGLAQAGRLHVGAVGERLDAGEDDRRRVGHGREGDRRALVGQRLGGGDPPAAAGDDQPQLGVAVAEALQERRDLALERLALDRQLDGGRGALEAVEVLGQRVRPPRVEADDLEDAVAAIKAVVGERDHRLRGGPDRPVDACQLMRAHRQRGYPRTGAQGRSGRFDAGLRWPRGVHARLARR